MGTLAGQIKRWHNGEPAKDIWGDEEGAIEVLITLAEEQQATIDRYRKAFTHTHEAKRVGGVLVDECATCGLDIRDEIHERLTTEGKEGTEGKIRSGL